MITCIRCRKQVTRTNAKYCYRCGYRLDAAASQTQCVAPQPPPNAVGSTRAQNTVLEMLANSGLPESRWAAVLDKFEPILKAAEDRARGRNEDRQRAERNDPKKS